MRGAEGSDVVQVEKQQQPEKKKKQKKTKLDSHLKSYLFRKILYLRNNYSCNDLEEREKTGSYFNGQLEVCCGTALCLSSFSFTFICNKCYLL